VPSSGDTGDGRFRVTPESDSEYCGDPSDNRDALIGGVAGLRGLDCGESDVERSSMPTRFTASAEAIFSTSSDIPMEARNCISEHNKLSRMSHKRGRITGKIVSKTHNRFKDDALRFTLMGGPRNRCDSDISVDPVLETVGEYTGQM
jgi:hypothetical protein